MSEYDLIDKFTEKIGEYLQSEFDKSTEQEEDQITFDSEEDSDEGEPQTFNPSIQGENIKVLQELILLIHGKYKGSNSLEGHFKFDKIIPIEELDYSKYENGTYVIDPKKLKRFIKDRISNKETSKDEFLAYLRKRHKLSDKDFNKLCNCLDTTWEYFDKCFKVIKSADEIIVNAQLGLIRLIDASPLDAQNIFSLVNGGGANLTAEELLSARPFWNAPIKNPSTEVKNEAKKLYEFLNIEVPNDVVRWDVCATLLSRIDKSHLIFTNFDLPDKASETNFTKKLTLGFKLFSAIKVGGISANSVKDLENDRKVKIDWSVDVEEYVSDFNKAVDMLYDCDFFKYLMSWKQSVMSLMGNSVALEFSTLIYKKWIELGKPVKGNNNLKLYQKAAIILFDRLVYEYSKRLWAGSADSRLARDLSNIGERFNPISSEDWSSVIDEFKEGKSSKTDKGIIYHYYCLKKMKPIIDGEGANAKYDIDHIYAQAQFNHVVTIDSSLMESLGNKAVLPKLENIAKSDKSIVELRPLDWLYSEVKRMTGIKEEDVEKYSDIINIQQLIDERIADYKTVFSNDRISLFNSSHF